MPDSNVDDRIALLEKRTETAESAIGLLEQQVLAIEENRACLEQFKQETFKDLEIIRSELLIREKHIKEEQAPTATNDSSNLRDALREYQIENKKLEYRILHLVRAFDTLTK